MTKNHPRILKVLHVGRMPLEFQGHLASKDMKNCKFFEGLIYQGEKSTIGPAIPRSTCVMFCSETLCQLCSLKCGTSTGIIMQCIYRSDIYIDYSILSIIFLPLQGESNLVSVEATGACNTTTSLPSLMDIRKRRLCQSSYVNIQAEGVPPEKFQDGSQQQRLGGIFRDQ